MSISTLGSFSRVRLVVSLGPGLASCIDDDIFEMCESKGQVSIA